MANITEDLQKILTSRYGKDVRQAIHDSISDINDVAESYEGQASASAESARLSAQSATTSAFNASESERYCRGVETQFSNAFIYCGTLTFAELMDLNIMMQKTGNCFNISDDFTSTEEFEDGGGKSYKAGTNVACTSNHKWDCLASDGGATDASEVGYGSGSVKDALDDLAEFSESEIISGCGLNFKFYKLGNVGKMQIQSGSTTAISADTVVCTAPIGFRPRLATRGLIINGAGTGLCIGNFIIATDGRVIFKNALSSGTYARGDCDYFI